MTRRIERAMTLLRRGDLSVTEVCFEVGCSSLGTFSTRFTELVGRLRARTGLGITRGRSDCPPAGAGALRPSGIEKRPRAGRIGSPAMTAVAA